MPPTINSLDAYTRTAKILARKAKTQYHGTVYTLLRHQLGPGYPMITGPVKLSMVLHFTRRGRFDLDNRVKILQDALQYSRVMDDDSQIDLLVVRRGNVVKGGRVDIRVEAMIGD